jgi:hypothetical protein
MSRRLAVTLLVTSLVAVLSPADLGARQRPGAGEGGGRAVAWPRWTASSGAGRVVAMTFGMDRLRELVLSRVDP